MDKQNYSITGMHCAACQARVEKAVSGLDGVESVSASLLTNSLAVTGNVAPAEVVKAVEKAGYSADLREDLPDLVDPGISDLKKRLISSVILLLILMYFSMGHSMLGLPLPEGLESSPFALGLIQMVLAAVIMLINKAFFTGGFGSLFRLAPNMDSLVAMGSMTSFLWSLHILIKILILQRGGDLDGAMMQLHQLFFESAAMIVTLITVGKLLEALSKGRTTSALKGLMEMTPRKAWIEKEEGLVEIPAEELEPGDIFACRAGDVIPVDGIILDGKTTVDESTLTGESAPREKTAGDSISAATTNLSGFIRAKASRVGDDTTLAQIIKMVSDASATKAPIARIADKVSGVFVPVVIGIAALVILVWLLLGAEPGYALSRGIAVLVISCPCALGLATPVAIMAGSGVGARNGILFKTAEALENTGKIQTLALDKTGTLTEGRPRPDGVISPEDMEEDKLREDSPKAVEEIKAMGIHVIMLTGDRKETAQAIGDAAGVDEIASELMPGDKESFVRKAKSRGRVAMVGDGINDGPALMSADVGIAIGAGADVALDAADIVLVNSNLSDVAAAVRLSRSTLRNIHQNLFWAFFYNILLIPLAAGVFTGLLHGWTLSPMLAAAAMSLSSFCVCMNALRLNLLDIHDPSRDKKIKRQGLEPVLSDDRIDEDEERMERTHSIDEQAEGEGMKKTLNIEGMMCTHCEATVKKALEEIDGVAFAEVSHEAGTATVSLDADVEDATLIKAVEDRDYSVTSLKQE